MEALSIGSGFAKGLANIFLGKRQRDQEEAFARENRNTQIKLSMLPEILKRAENYADVAPFIDEILGGGSGKGKKGAADPQVHGILEQFLGPALTKPTEGALANAASGEQAMNAAGSMTGEDPVLPSRPAVSPATPPKQKQTLFGIPILGDDELAARDTARAVAQEKAVTGARLDAQTEAKLAQANRLRTLDPTMSVEDSLIAVGLKIPKTKFQIVPEGSDILNTDTQEIIDRPSRNRPLTGALGERTREIQALNPDMDEDEARRTAADQLANERGADREARAATAASLQANRAIQGTLLKMQESLGGITPNNAAALTTTLRKDWTKAIAPFKTRETYVAKLNEAVTPDKSGKTQIQRDRNAATQNIINSFNRLLEEGNAVKEGEYQRSESLAPMLTWVEAQLSALQQGGGGLTDTQLTSLAKEGIRIANVTKDVHEEGLRDMRTAITRQLQNYHIPPEDVFGNSKVGAPAFSATLNGKIFTFPDQAKLDAWKRQFPAAQ